MLNVYEIVVEDVLFDEIFWGSFWCFGTDYLSDWLRVYSVLPTLTLNPSQSACSPFYILLLLLRGHNIFCTYKTACLIVNKPAES